MSVSHSWNLSPSEAIELQNELAPKVDTSTPIDLDSLSTVAGVDVSVKNNISRAAIVVLTYPALEVIESVTARQPTPFPYVPGLLSFREGDVILTAHDKLQTVPDVYIFDGAGIAHQRHIGIATHIGLWLDRPTVGCAKKRLVGSYEEVSPEKGSMEDLVYKGAIVGQVVRTRTNVKPVFISPGHKATVDTASQLILNTVTKYRLPEPVRAAHNRAGDF
jgi:deoxyribonuclease V